MSEASAIALEAKSPFELRVHLGDSVPEQSVRDALATGDMGFLHSYTTGSTVDEPGVRVVAWTTGCMCRCQYCHNPDTWTVTNGRPVSVANAAEELGRQQADDRAGDAGQRDVDLGQEPGGSLCLHRQDHGRDGGHREVRAQRPGRRLAGSD